MYLIDTHAHYTLQPFQNDRKERLQRLASFGVYRVVNAAIDFASNEEMLQLAKEYPLMYTAVGIHPKHAHEAEEWQFRLIEKMLEKERVIAVGETGLDYHHGNEHKAIQKYWFHRFIDLAVRQDKPLIIHSRMATADTLDVLRMHSLPTRPGIIHCFHDDYETALAYIHMGFKLGVGGAFTKDEADAPRLDALKRVPKEAIVLETDCPYLMPQGCEGNVNDSKNLPVILQELARLRGEEEEELAEVIFRNTLDCFPEMGEEV